MNISELGGRKPERLSQGVLTIGGLASNSRGNVISMAEVRRRKADLTNSTIETNRNILHFSIVGLVIGGVFLAAAAHQRAESHQINTLPNTPHATAKK